MICAVYKYTFIHSFIHVFSWKSSLAREMEWYRFDLRAKIETWTGAGGIKMRNDYTIKEKAEKASTREGWLL